MGVVLAAVHVELGHRVAIKVLRDRSESRVERFRREARIVAQLQSEHVARVSDSGLLPDGSPFVVMDFLEGHDLEEEIKKRSPLPIDEAVGHILAASEAIAEAHACGIIHRDIKPKNLFLAMKVGGLPVLKVLDFGLAKVEPLQNASVTHSQDVFGSPAYMAPEQMRSAKDVDARADIWALGITLYELLVGKPPFDAGSVAETCALVLREPTPSIRASRPEVTLVLARIIEKCLEKEPEDRFGSVLELVQRLEPFGPRSLEGISKRIEAISTAPRSDRFLSMRTPREPIPITPLKQLKTLTPREELPTLGAKSSEDLSVEMKPSGAISPPSLRSPTLSWRSRGGFLVIAMGVVVIVGAALFVTRRGKDAATPPIATAALPTPTSPATLEVAPSPAHADTSSTPTASATSVAQAIEDAGSGSGVRKPASSKPKRKQP
jgi:serine/threonine-protein kinase